MSLIIFDFNVYIICGLILRGLNSLIVIPITGQMLHFYLDSQLWKFSEEHNRQNTLKFILEKI